MIKLKHMSYEKKKGLYGYAFLGLWLIGTAVFFVSPIIQSLRYSLSKVAIVEGGLEITYVGFENYIRAFTRDAIFRQALVQALQTTAIKLPIIIVFSMFVAVIINQKFKGRLFARAIFFLPVIIATGPVYEIITGGLSTTGNANAEQFSAMFEANMVDQLLEFVGIYGFGEVFTNRIKEIMSDILNLVWACGIQIIIFLSALQSIPQTAKEAAAIEGATSWEFFWKITLPYVSSMILVNIVYTIVDTFRDLTNPVMIKIMAEFRGLSYDYSAALSWSYFAIVLISLGLVLLIVRKFIWYEND